MDQNNSFNSLKVFEKEAQSSCRYHFISLLKPSK